MFIEVKQVGRAVEGDRQLFEYSFHQGVPLCVLTDGREWSFYLPSGQGSYEDRRVYRLQLDDREPTECERVLIRYLQRERVRSQAAFEDAQRDHRDAAGRREAVGVLPRAWAELVTEGHELLIEALGDKAEALCGYKPSAGDVLRYLSSLRSASGEKVSQSFANAGKQIAPMPQTLSAGQQTPSDRTVNYTIFGEQRSASNAAAAMVDVLRSIAARDPSRLTALSDAIRGPKRCLIAPTVQQINPDRPDLARAVEIAPGWLVGLNISNREKMAIIRAACAIYELAMPGDLEFVLPNG